jgi:hypothetical protein
MFFYILTLQTNSTQIKHVKLQNTTNHIKNDTFDLENYILLFPQF